MSHCRVAAEDFLAVHFAVRLRGHVNGVNAVVRDHYLTGAACVLAGCAAVEQKQASGKEKPCEGREKRQAIKQQVLQKMEKL